MRRHFCLPRHDGLDLNRRWQAHARMLGDPVIVRDGIYYAAGLTFAGALISYPLGPAYSLPLFVLAAFCLYFFRDPERPIPAGAVAVAPADGRVVAVRTDAPDITRISIFLNIFDVHVNRSPISGRITEVRYQKGCFKAATLEECSMQNEQNIVTVEGDGTRVVFKQIAGLIARRIVFTKKTGDYVQLGERIGMIKFGSRMDVLFGPEWEVVVRLGERVSAGSSVIAMRKDRFAFRELAEALPAHVEPSHA